MPGGYSDSVFAGPGSPTLRTGRLGANPGHDYSGEDASQALGWLPPGYGNRFDMLWPGIAGCSSNRKGWRPHFHRVQYPSPPFVHWGSRLFSMRHAVWSVTVARSFAQMCLKWMMRRKRRKSSCQRGGRSMYRGSHHCMPRGMHLLGIGERLSVSISTNNSCRLWGPIA
jgi:hypothetical protein